MRSFLVTPSPNFPFHLSSASCFNAARRFGNRRSGVMFAVASNATATTTGSLSSTSLFLSRSSSSSAQAASNIIAISSAIPFTSRRTMFSTTRVQRAADEADSSSSSSSGGSSNVVLPSWTDPTSRNLYTRLGLRNNATTEDIKKHYRHLAKKYHPDQNQGSDNKEQASERFRQVKEAYETLSNTDKRRTYDSTGASASEQEQHGFGSGFPGGPAGFKGWRGSGLHGSYYVRYNAQTGRPEVTVPKFTILIFLFSMGMLFGAASELRERRKRQQALDNTQAQGLHEGGTNLYSTQSQLAKERSSLWRPFFGILLIGTFLPRLPGTILVWYFYVYRPTLKAEDRAAVDDVTVIVKDEMEGQASSITLQSPYFTRLAMGGLAVQKNQEHIMTVTLRPLPPPSSSPSSASFSTTQQQQPTPSGSSGGIPVVPAVDTQSMLPPAVEYPSGQPNSFHLSFPKARSTDGRMVLPSTATVRVKTVVRDTSGKIQLDQGTTVFERQLQI